MITDKDRELAMTIGELLLPNKSIHAKDHVMSHFDAVCQMLAEHRESQWQPIETAPKDGTAIFIHEKGFLFPCIAIWQSEEENHDAYEGWYIYGMEFLHSCEPTHWQPLPAPPKESK